MNETIQPLRNGHDTLQQQVSGSVEPGYSELTNAANSIDDVAALAETHANLYAAIRSEFDVDDEDDEEYEEDDE